MRGRGPALAFWLLVVVADLALVVSTAGVVTALSILAALFVVGTVVRQTRTTKVRAQRRA